MSNKIHYTTLVFVILLFSLAVAKDFVYTSAKLEKEKANITALVDKGNYAQAKTQTQKLIAAFAKDSELPKALSEIADRYRWADKYEDAKAIYQQIIHDYPDSPTVADAQFGLARMEVFSLMMLQKYDAAKEAINKMVDDFSEHPDFPEELYWIARKYGWSERHEEEKAVYQQIMKDYPDSPYVEKAALGTARANIQCLIVSKDYDGAQKAIDKMVVDFANNPYLHDALYWIAERDEWAGRLEDAKRLHQQIVKNYPDSSSAQKAKLGSLRTEVLSLMMSQGYDQAEKALDKMIADFNDNPALPETVLSVGVQCYDEGLAKESEDLAGEAKGYFEKAAKIWEKLADKLPKSALAPAALCRAGDCYLKLGKHEDSIRCFQKAVDDYPKYEHAGHAQYMVGCCYGELKEKGAVEESVADEKIKAAYEKVIKNYPDCLAAGHVRRLLSAETNIGKEKER